MPEIAFQRTRGLSNRNPSGLGVAYGIPPEVEKGALNPDARC